MTKLPRIASGAVAAALRPFLRRLAKSALPRYGGELTLQGLTKRVEVFWQSEGIPHVFAANEEDLFFAQGYLHAQERLWQMDLNRRFLAGRMAEILGQFSVPWQDLTSQFRGCDSIDADYFMRLIGIRRAALASLALLSHNDRQVLEAYSCGVNRYIEDCGKQLPLEFRLLRYLPEPWRPEDTLTIGKGFAFLLSLALFTRLNAIAVATKFPDEPEKFRDLYPSCADDGSTITRAVWDSTQKLWRFTAGMLAADDGYPAGHGSNAWVIGPDRTTTGGAILCNDPHLRLTVPSVWYLMHLKAETRLSRSENYEVWGATVPGSPGVQIGHNRWIAWGVTAALCDDVEIYREKLHPLEPDRYAVAGGWGLMQRQKESIRVKRKGLVEKTVRWTRHGPVISDFNGRASAREVLSLCWTAHEASRDFRGLRELNGAHDWEEFLAALSHQSAPTLNFLYADRSGNIGYSLAGKIPLRAGAPSVLPREGWHARHDWRGFIPFDELPRLFNPAGGAIANANNRIADAAYSHYLSEFFEPPFRVRRIHQLLAAKQNHSAADMSVMQGDLVSLHARELITILGGELKKIVAEKSANAAAADKLLRWDCRCGAESVEAAVFHVFYHHLVRNLLIPALGEDILVTYSEIFNQSIMPLERILRAVDSSWFCARSRAELVRIALTDARAELKQSLGSDEARWRWGKLHCLSLNHAFSRVGILKRLLSVGPFPSGGDNFTVNLSFYRHSNPYQPIVGPSMRMIVETGSTLRSTFILPSGQSGHPFVSHYRDQTQRWQRQESIQLTHGEEEIRRRPLLTLNPAS